MTTMTKVKVPKVVRLSKGAREELQKWGPRAADIFAAAGDPRGATAGSAVGLAIGLANEATEEGRAIVDFDALCARMNELIRLGLASAHARMVTDGDGRPMFSQEDVDYIRAGALASGIRFMPAGMSERYGLAQGVPWVCLPGGDGPSEARAAVA